MKMETKSLNRAVNITKRHDCGIVLTKTFIDTEMKWSKQMEIIPSNIALIDCKNKKKTKKRLSKTIDVQKLKRIT